jgi:hypothetical protein
MHLLQPGPRGENIDMSVNAVDIVTTEYFRGKSGIPGYRPPLQSRERMRLPSAPLSVSASPTQR